MVVNKENNRKIKKKRYGRSRSSRTLRHGPRRNMMYLGGILHHDLGTKTDFFFLNRNHSD